MKMDLRVVLVATGVICAGFLISGFYTALVLTLMEDEADHDGSGDGTYRFNGSPKAFLLPSIDPKEPLNVTFERRTFYAQGDNGVTFIELGDGSPNVTLTMNRTLHRYPALGTYDISYETFFHKKDHWDTGTMRLELNKAGNMTPVAVIVEEEITTKIRNQPVLISGNASFDVDGEIVGFYWDYGDGTHSDITQGIHGYLPGPVTSHAYDKIGKYEVTLSVMDDQGYVSTFDDAARITVTVHG